MSKTAPWNKNGGRKCLHTQVFAVPVPTRCVKMFSSAYLASSKYMRATNSALQVHSFCKPIRVCLSHIQTFRSHDMLFAGQGNENSGCYLV